MVCRAVTTKTTELWGTCLHFGTAEPICGAGTTKNDGIVGHLPAFRDCRADLRGRYYTKRRNCGAPACFSGLQSRFEGQVLHRKAELCCTCLSDGVTGDRRWFAGQLLQKQRNYGVPAFISGLQSRFAGQVLHRKAELCCTCLGDGETGVPEPVCGAGTTQIGGIVGHLPSFRGC